MNEKTLGTPQDWQDLAETCRALLDRLAATAGEPLNRETLEPALSDLDAVCRRLGLSATPACWEGEFSPTSMFARFGLEYSLPAEPHRRKSTTTANRAAVAALQAWVRFAEQTAAELELLDLPSWPMHPFAADRPQRLPPPRPRGLTTFSGRAAEGWAPAAVQTDTEGTPTPGGTVRLSRDGVAVELYFPTAADRATLAAALPSCDLINPPWHAVQARLVSAGLSADWQRLTAPAAVAMLARTSTPQAETSTPGTRQSEGIGVGPQENKPPALGGTKATGDEPNRYAALDKLKPAYRKAYLAFLCAEAKTERRLQDRDAWDWLNENGTDGAGSGELDGYELPTFASWARYLRSARQAVGEQKYTPRSARPTGGSIVHADELDRQEPGAE